MKRIITLCALILGVTSAASAQLKVTPEVGMLMMLNKDNEPGHTTPGVGGYIGAGVRYMFKGDETGFGLQSGLYYQLQKSPKSTYPVALSPPRSRTKTWCIHRRN